jgi:hypothetical protein
MARLDLIGLRVAERAQLLLPPTNVHFLKRLRIDDYAEEYTIGLNSSVYHDNLQNEYTIKIIVAIINGLR